MQGKEVEGFLHALKRDLGISEERREREGE